MRTQNTRNGRSSSERRAEELGLYVEYVDRRKLHNLYKGLCGICGEALKFRAMTIDHIVPLSKGGPHSYENTQPAHRLCNHIKGCKGEGEYDLYTEIDKIKRKRASKKYRNVTGRTGVRQGLVHTT